MNSSAGTRGSSSWYCHRGCSFHSLSRMPSFPLFWPGGRYPTSTHRSGWCTPHITGRRPVHRDEISSFQLPFSRASFLASNSFPSYTDLRTLTEAFVWRQSHSTTWTCIEFQLWSNLFTRFQTTATCELWPQTSTHQDFKLMISCLITCNKQPSTHPECLLHTLAPNCLHGILFIIENNNAASSHATACLVATAMSIRNMVATQRLHTSSAAMALTQASCQLGEVAIVFGFGAVSIPNSCTLLP
mmetsp:Transcript_26542/g.57897  ORF Transcript_26542/g.57897 Transcript_26542/m.57897 type:complete len:244 (-) Transcript_26542:60-791(-)